ncbi:MAG: hypothetical protein ACKVVT_16030 [Dehalococcoidia bacterium]
MEMPRRATASRLARPYPLVRPTIWASLGLAVLGGVVAWQTTRPATRPAPPRATAAWALQQPVPAPASELPRIVYIVPAAAKAEAQALIRETETIAARQGNPAEWSVVVAAPYQVEEAAAMARELFDVTVVVIHAAIATEANGHS